MSSRLRELADERLLQIRVQQGFTSERSRTAGITGPSMLPADFETTGTRGVTWEVREQTFSELVVDLRTFLTRSARNTK